MPAGVSAYVPLANVTLSSSAASVTFSSISQAYRDLVLVCSILGDGSGWATIRLNNDSASSYGYVLMSGDGSTARSATNTPTSILVGYYATFDTTNRMQMNCNFLDYSATDKHKSGVHRVNVASTATEATAFRWPSTSAISSMVVIANNTTFASGSTFALYGVSA